MGLFNKKNLGGMNWEDHLTEQDVDALEKSGVDVTELREKFTKKTEEQEMIKSAFQDTIHLEMLNHYINTPRDTDSKFFKDVAGKAPLFGKSKWLETFQNADIIYASVVQANSDLWTPGISELLPAVIVYTNDRNLRFDIEWLKKIGDKIHSLKDSQDVPKDCKSLIKSLKDDQSMFFYKVGESISEGKNVWCQTFSFPKQFDLPNKCLPPNGIVPFLLHYESDKVMLIHEIPGKYYSGDGVHE